MFEYEFSSSDLIRHLEMFRSDMVIFFCLFIVFAIFFCQFAFLVKMIIELWTLEGDEEPFVAPGPGSRGDGMHVVYQIFLHNMMMTHLHNVPN
jgi:hypothetical protein